MVEKTRGLRMPTFTNDSVDDISVLRSLDYQGRIVKSAGRTIHVIFLV